MKFVIIIQAENTKMSSASGSTGGATAAAAAAAAAATPIADSPEDGVSKLTPIWSLRELTTDSIGQCVRLYGWVEQARVQGSGTIVFVDLGADGLPTPIRCIAHRPASVDSDGKEEDASAAGAVGAVGTTSAASAASATGTDSADAAEIEYGSIQVSDDDPHSDISEFKLLSFSELCETRELSRGCSVMIYGQVVPPLKGTTQPFEVKIIELYVIDGVSDPDKYPIQRSNATDFLALRSLTHDRFRALLIQQVMIVRSSAQFAIDEFMVQREVVKTDPNIITASDCEGAGETFELVQQFFSADAIRHMHAGTAYPGPKAGLTVSSQLPLEATSKGLKQVYTCQKSFRAEHSDTNKHLCEFLHIEYEGQFHTLKSLMDFTEAMVKQIIRTVLERCSEQYDFFDHKFKSPTELTGHRDYLRSLLDEPFVRIKHANAITEMQADVATKAQVPNDQGKMVRLKFKTYPRHGEDLGSEHEKYLVQKYGTFVFVTHWPLEIKSFYMKQCDDGSGECESFDLLAPIVGELFGGSMREWREEKLDAEIHKRKMDIRPLQWFVDLRKDGSAPHGGWGLGFDRLVMLLTKAPSVRDVVPYPVYYGHCPC